VAPKNGTSVPPLENAHFRSDANAPWGSHGWIQRLFAPLQWLAPGLTALLLPALLCFGRSLRAADIVVRGTALSSATTSDTLVFDASLAGGTLTQNSDLSVLGSLEFQVGAELKYTIHVFGYSICF